jgi:hypothetical protein
VQASDAEHGVVHTVAFETVATGRRALRLATPGPSTDMITSALARHDARTGRCHTRR